VIDAPLKSDDQLAIITSQAFRHLHYKEMNIVKDNSLDVLIQYIAQGKWLKSISIFLYSCSPHRPSNPRYSA